MKYKCKLLFVLTLVIVFLFYSVDPIAAMAAEQNPDSTAEAEPTQIAAPAAEADMETGSEHSSAIISAPEPAQDSVSTGQALTEWLESHKNTGGTVKLAGHVVLDNEYYSYCPNGINMPSVFVDTDKYTITITGEVDLLSDGNLTFSGQPDGKSIFYIAEKGMLSIQGVAVESGQCALWQEEGAGLVVGDCHISGSIHYADTPFVLEQDSICAVVDKGETANNVLPAQINCTVNRQGQVSHNEPVPISWNLEGCDKEQEERRRFQVQGSFLHAASAEPVLCTVAYNDYPLSFTDVRASVSGSQYIFKGWYTKPEKLPITVMSEYSFDGENWFMYEEAAVKDSYAGFFIAVESKQRDMAAHPEIYIRLQWNDNGTRYFSNVLCYAADNLEHVDDIGGSRGGGTSITNPPDSPQTSIDDASVESEEQDQNANRNTSSDNTESEAPADTNRTEKGDNDSNLNAAGDGQAPNEVSSNTGENRSVSEESKTGSAEQPSYTEQITDNNVINSSNSDSEESMIGSDSVIEKKEETIAVSSVYGEKSTNPLTINEQSLNPDIRESNTIVIATGFVLLSTIAGIAGFCFHSRSGTKR